MEDYLDVKSSVTEHFDKETRAAYELFEKRHVERLLLRMQF